MAQWRAETCCWEIWLKIHFNNYLTEVVVRLYFIFMYYYYYWNTMGMSHLKIIKTSQGYIHKYENLKRKLCNCNANISTKNVLLVINKYYQFYISHFLKKRSAWRWLSDEPKHVAERWLKIHFNNYLTEVVRRYFIFIYRLAHEKPARRLVDQRGRRSRTLYRKLNKCKCKLLTG